MSNNISAFPTKRYNANIMQMEDMGGMTLRDYFAAKAMQAMASRFEASSRMLASSAYEVADAMLEARQ